ncbi:MAG: amidohydrolase [Armatimonadota bacterium]|nr:amidohydrolase [Armatimonadota bacterium]
MPAGDGVLFINGRIRTLDPSRPRAEALAVIGGRIVAVGSSSDLRGAFPRLPVRDLGGRAVLPGFIDAHIHLPALGLGLRRLDLRHTRSIGEAAALVARAAAQARPGEWIQGQGWDKNVWSEDRFPTRADLDPVAPHHPVVLSSKDGHLLWVNTAALRAAGIDRRSPDPPGGAIARDSRGEPTGILKEAAKDLVWRIVPETGVDLLEAAILEAQRLLHRQGITGVHHFTGTAGYDGPPTFAAFQSLAARGRLRLRVWMAIPERALESARAVGLRTGFGGEWLRVGPVKIFADGTLGSQTAAMLEPFEGQADNTGIAIHSREELTELVGRAVGGGFWCAIHAIGDRANRWALDAYQVHHEASRALGARHRIEHVQLVHPDDLPRLARLGVTASMQPVHATSDRDMADRYWGARSRTAYAWRSLLRAGTLLAFGSDAPVETAEVFEGLYAAVTRRRPREPDRPGWYPEEALEVEEAILAYTAGAAYAAGQESVQGRLAEGCFADFVVLDRDILTCPQEDLLNATVELTVVGGEVVYEG